MSQSPAHAQNETLLKRDRFVMRLGLLVAMIGLGLLVQRGFLRGLAAGVDWTMIWAASRAFWGGSDPYVFDELYAAWLSGGGDSLGPAWSGGWTPASMHALYPPGTYCLLGPMALFGWPAAKIAWAVLNTGLILLVGVWLGRWVVRARGRLAWGFVAAGLVWGFGPGHTAIMQGQPTVLVMGLALVGLTRRRAWAEGLWLAAAALLKPQLGLPLALGGFAGGLAVMAGVSERDPLGWQWRRGATVFGFAAAGFAGLNLLTAWVIGPEWLSGLRANLQVVADGGYTDARPGARFAFHSVDARPIGYLLFGSDAGARWLALGGAGVAGLLGVAALLKTRVPATPVKNDPMPKRFFPGAGAWVVLLAACAMWVVYHRYYDGLVYLPVIGLLLGYWRGLPLFSRGAMMLGVALWFVPVGSLVLVLSDRFESVDVLMQRLLPKLLFAHAANWGTVCLAVGALASLWRDRVREDAAGAEASVGGAGISC